MRLKLRLVQIPACSATPPMGSSASHSCRTSLAVGLHFISTGPWDCDSNFAHLSSSGVFLRWTSIQIKPLMSPPGATEEAWVTTISKVTAGTEIWFSTHMWSEFHSADLSNFSFTCMLSKERIWPFSYVASISEVAAGREENTLIITRVLIIMRMQLGETSSLPD